MGEKSAVIDYKMKKHWISATMLYFIKYSG